MSNNVDELVIGGKSDDVEEVRLDFKFLFQTNNLEDLKHYECPLNSRHRRKG